MYGQNAPFTVDELPPGLLRSSLESLPPQAKSRAMNWLHSFDFPENDLEYLGVDPEGGVFYSDTYKPEPVESSPEVDTSSAPAVDPNTTFMLHSNPGSTNTLYLDFDGHSIQNTAWNNGALPVYDAKPFDPNNNAGFDTDELARIAEIWHRVAEDMAPFDIDVTTEDPITFGPSVGRALITHNQDTNGNAMPYSGSGGVAYVNVWGRSDYPTYYSPALVYYNNLGSGHAPYVAEATSHEFGHNIGLSHDGTRGPNAVGYYEGHGSDSSYVSWAPIMGVGYYKNVTQWSKGEYPDANNTQDDLTIIDGDLGYRIDDHGDDLINATQLLMDAAGNVLSTNPEADAYNDAPYNKGIIERGSDFDMFYFDAGAGPLTLTVTPAWDAFYRTVRRGANLDIEAVLYDSSGALVTFDDPLDDTDATLSATVPAGRYYLRVNGIDNTQTPYSDYGSLGMYFIQGTVTPEATGPNDPPSASFASSCTGLDCNFIDSSSDPDGSIIAWGWNFGDGSVSTAQNPNHSYTAGGSYNVTLTATDSNGATDNTSTLVTVTAPNAVPASNFTFSCTGLGCTFIDTSSDSDGSVASWSWSFGDANTSAAQNPVHSYTAGGTYSVTLTVTDNEGATDNRTQQVTATDPNAQPPGQPSGASASNNSDGSATVSWNAVEGALTYDIQRQNRHPRNGKWVGTTILVTGHNASSYLDQSGSGTFRYSVLANNNNGSSAWSDWSTEVDVTGGSGGGGSGGGGGKKCNPRKTTCP
jgi:PKD repeat protein